jgi:hypothetical protein
MDTHDAELQDRVKAWLGTGMMIAASAFAVLIFCDRMRMTFVPLPAVWFSSRELHLLICGGMFLAAAILLKGPPPAENLRDGRPLFQTCRLITRQHCSLCDDAMATLLRFQDALPSIEIVDIDDDPRLARQFGESIPVVEIDGRVRFRGCVQPVLLKRMIEAAEIRANQPEGAMFTADVSSSGILADRKR